MRSTEFINEMAVLRDADRTKVFYHGTDTTEAAKGIVKDGLNPAQTEIKYGKKNTSMKPVAGRVYLSESLTYAMIYAIGGDMAGCDVSRDIPKLGQFGYVFAFSGESFGDVQPDEDSIGGFLARWWEQGDYYRKTYPEWFSKAEATGGMRQLSYLAQQKLTPNMISKIKDGDYAWWAKSGKKLIQFMSDELKLDMIALGAHVAHEGQIRPLKCFRFDRKDVVNMKRDGSNFFDFATEINIGTK